jgi:hypothetical protein
VPTSSHLSPSPPRLSPPALAAALAVRDLTDPTQGRHAVQLVVTAIEDALATTWGVPVRRHRHSLIVTIEENYDRLGYEREADEIQDLFLSGERDKAIAAVPASAVDDISLVGPVSRIRDRLAMWTDAGVTHLGGGAPDRAHLRRVAEVVLGA